MNAPVVAQRPWSGFALVTLSYVLAHVVAGAVVQVMTGLPTWQVVAVADVAATLVVFVFSRVFDNTSFYDPYWSVVPASIVTWLIIGPGSGQGLTARQGLIAALVFAYALRLTFNWARGWEGLRHEDWRYADLRVQMGRLYWVVSFVGLHLMPTVMTYLGALPLFAPLTQTPAGFGALDVVAAVVTAAAIFIEGLSDEQLRAFRKGAHGSGDICNVGLWKYSRHPNYFGEISFWLGLYLFGLAGGAPWWTGVGVVAMVVLFATASIPLAEKRSLKRRPHYAEHQRRVSMIIPWFPKP